MSAWIYIQQCAWNFDKHERVKKSKALENPGAPSDKQKRVLDYFIQFSKKKSFQKSDQVSSISQNSIHDIPANRLDMFSYKLHIFQQLEDGDYTAENNVWSWILQNIQAHV